MIKNKNIDWLGEKIKYDELARFKYVNYADMRPYIFKRCVVNELKADERKRFWKHFWEYAKPIAGGVVLAVGMWLLLVMILTIL